MVQSETKFKLPEVFIVSSGRSGTTLLASILNASEQVYIPYESDFIARAYPFYQDKQQLSAEDYQQLFQLFKLAAKQDGWGMAEEYVVDALKARAPQTFAEVNSVIYEAFHRQEKTDHLMWGIKAPVLIASLDRILQVCPQSKLVHIVRDGRDVYLSYKKVHQTSDVKFGPKGVIENALYWVDGLRRVEDFIRLHPDAQLYELQYNHLLSDPAPTLKQLCEFLDIEYRPAMYENFNALERNQKVAPDRFKQTIHQKLRGGLDPQNTKKYLASMSPLEQLQFELIAGPYLAKYGYPLEYPILNIAFLAPLRWFAYSVARWFNDWRYAKRDRKVYQQSCSSV